MSENKTEEKTGAEKLLFGRPSKTAPSLKDFLKRDGEVVPGTYRATATVRELVNAALRGQVRGYIHNRGDQGEGTSRLRIKDCQAYALTFDPVTVGEITLADVGRGYYEIARGHTRIGTMLEVYKNNGLRNIADVPVSIKVVPENEALEHFASEGRGKSQHTLSMTLRNVDMGFGKYLKGFFTGLPIQPVLGVKVFPSKVMPLAAQVIRAGLSIPNPDMVSYGEMIRKVPMSEIKKLADLRPEQFSLAMKKDAASEAKLNEAFRFTLLTLGEVVRRSNKNALRGSKKASIPKLASSIITNANFQSFLVWDKFAGLGILSEVSEERIASQLLKKGDLTAKALSALSAKRYTDGINDLRRIVRTRSAS